MESSKFSWRSQRKTITVAVGLSVVAGFGILWVAGSSVEAFHAGMVAFDRHDLAELDALIEKKCSGEAPTNVNCRILKAARELLKSNPSEALEFLSSIEAVPDELDSRTAYLRVSGEAHFQLGSYGRATSEMRKLVELAPDDLRVQRLLAVMYFDLGAMELAISHLKEVIRLAPNDHRPHQMIAQIYFDFEQYDDAATAYRATAARATDPLVQSEALLFAGRCEARQKRFAEAMSVMSQVITWPATFGVQAECLWNLGKQDEAQTILQKALQRENPDQETVVTYAQICMEDDHAEDAIPVLQKYVQSKPTCVETRHQLAMMFRIVGKTDECQRQLEKNETIKALKSQLTELSVEAIDRPDDPEIREQLAGLCEQLQMSKMADTWRKAAESIRGIPARDGVGGE